jgi:urease accessory protein
MTLGTILVIILIIFLLGGFSGIGGGPFYGTGNWGGGSLGIVVVALLILVLMGRLPMAVLFPAFAVHGYVLSGSVIGWTTMPVAFYLLGLLLSQGALLLLSLNMLRPLAARLRTPVQQWLAAALIGCGGAWTWSALVG